MRRGERTQRPWGLAVAGAMAALAAIALDTTGVGATPQTSGAQAPPSIRLVAGAAGTIHATGAIRHRQLRADGSLARAEAPAVAFVLDRRETGGAWRTTMTFPPGGGPVVRNGTRTMTLDNPFAVGRVEIDERLAEARAFDRAGRPVGLPGDAERRRFGIRDSQRPSGWDARLFAGPPPTLPSPVLGPGGAYADAGLRDRRRLDLQQAFGRPAGRVRGLERYLVRDDAETRELLVSPESYLPAELNVVSGGALTFRMQMQYARVGTAGFVRQVLRSERVAGPSSPGEVIVTDVAFSDVEVATGGVR